MRRNGLAAAALGAIALVWGGYTFRQARVSASWPTVEGTVIQSRLAYVTAADRNTPDGQRARERDLVYRYVVDGQAYESRLISYSDDAPLALLWPRIHDERLLERYPRDAVVTVHYDPDDPARAVLETGGGGQALLILLGGLVAIGYAAWEGRNRP